VLTYARGPARFCEAIVGSTFSKGDILMLTSTSSVSRIPTSTASVGALATATVAGVALADSTSSLNNKVPVIMVERDTIFWSDCTTGSTFTAGKSYDVEYTGATFRLTTSVISPMLRVVQNGNSSDLATTSSTSRVMVKFAEAQLLYQL